MSPALPLSMTPFASDSLDSLTQVINVTQFAPSCNSIANAIGEFVLTRVRLPLFCRVHCEANLFHYLVLSPFSQDGMSVAYSVSDQTEGLRTLQPNRLVTN